MPNPELQLQLHVGLEREADGEEIDRLTRQLLRELEESDFASGQLGEAVVPKHAKSAGAVDLGSLLVSLLPSAFPKLVSFLQSWLKREDLRTITIKASSGDASFEVECPIDTLDQDQIKNLLEKLSNPVASKKHAPSRKTAK